MKEAALIAAGFFLIGLVVAMLYTAFTLVIEWIRTVQALFSWL